MGAATSRRALERAAAGSTRPSSARRAALDDAGGRYIEFCKSTFAQRAVAARACTIVVDGAHGAAYHVAPDVFHELGAEVIADRLPSPTASTSTTASARPRRRRWSTPCARSGADYGIALDGDADRLQMVDAPGRLYNGDELLYVMAADRLARGPESRAWSAR